MNLPNPLPVLKRAWLAVWKRKSASSSTLKGLIRGVEESSGYARNDARAKAKAWLLTHVSSMSQQDIELARLHFAYLLPVEWGFGDLRQV